MPVRCAIPLDVERPELVRPAYVHAWVCEALERELAPTRHYGNDKPFATSPLRTHADGVVAFEVGMLDDELEERLLAAVARQRGRFRLGRQVGRLVGPPETMARGTWEELARQAVARREFRFQFVTATTFRSEQTSVPLPLPKSVFGHYRSRWTTFAPPDLRPEIAFDELRFQVSDLDIATMRFPLNRREQIGFVGHVSLSLREAEPEVHAMLDALASIATYSGTGAGTPQGMGVTRYLGGRPLGAAGRAGRRFEGRPAAGRLGEARPE